MKIENTSIGNFLSKALVGLLCAVGLICHGQNPAIEQALAAVVTVAVEKHMEVGKLLMAYRGAVSEVAYSKSLEISNALGTGSGFVIEQGGEFYIVTNAHVVESASEETGSIYVYSYSRSKYEVRIVGGDTFYDIAVLRFVDAPGPELHAISFAEKQPFITQKVYAIGNPLGNYPYTVTDGIVSAVNRTRGGLTGKFGYIQSTATMIWGNSGGPLVDETGNVVGVNTQIAFATGPDGQSYLQQQLNFSLEPLLSSKIVDEIIAEGGLRRCYVGLELAQRFALVTRGQHYGEGAAIDALPRINAVLADAPSYSMLSPYVSWQISKIGAVEVRNVEEALEAFEKTAPGSVVRMELVRGDARKTIDVQTATMGKAQLESIARHVLENNQGGLLAQNSAQLKVQFAGEAMAAQQSSGKPMMQQGRPGVDGQYLIAAGVYNNAQQDLWRITTLDDLGVLLRIYGLRGGIEYILAEDESNLERVSKKTFPFGVHGQEVQYNLWN